ncbi:DUF4189 domain-containing protein [Hydrogenophaga sp. RWCD_12]|uniref:DUF4189 domain-containing protein n=1 Tax=Hydrogenophaga sp. RWCD_12 TaxID=3391190 RepID=UPI003984B987
MKKVWTWGAALIAAVVLVACGGGGDSNGFGAVAVSVSTKKIAISSESLTQSSANESARDECDASDCTVILQFEECGAASQGVTASGAWVIAAAAGNTAFDAQTAANASCSAKGGTGCAAIPNLEAQCN